MNGARCECCDGASTPRTHFCKNCGAGICRWSRRSAGDISDRVARLRTYTNRMDNLRAPRARRR